MSDGLMKHQTPESLLTRRVYVALIGAGGNGSRMLTGLAELDFALRALGHPGGLHVAAYDPDTVSESNVGRQRFSQEDVGLPKSILLVHRLNAFFGLDWRAFASRFEECSAQCMALSTDIVISCVDSNVARRAIYEQIKGDEGLRYWMDLGNSRDFGQVVMGQTREMLGFRRRAPRDASPQIGTTLPMTQPRLPHVFDLFPQMLEKSIPEDDAPSCSMAEALEKQSLTINQLVVSRGLTILESLFRAGGIDNHGWMVNAVTGDTPLPVPEAAPCL